MLQHYQMSRTKARQGKTLLPQDCDSVLECVLTGAAFQNCKSPNQVGLFSGSRLGPPRLFTRWRQIDAGPMSNFGCHADGPPSFVAVGRYGLMAWR